VLILYLVARVLRPIFDLTQATSKIKKGNYDVSVRQKGSDELSVLTDSFNSMIESMRDFIENRHALTWKLEAANVKLKNKDQLKDEFINIEAHQMRAPIQPILGLAEILLNRRGGAVMESNSNVNKEDIELLDIIIRNAKRLLRLEQNILDMARIEGKSLKLDKERFDLIEKIQNVINNFSNELLKQKVQLVFTPSPWRGASLRRD
jgi:signal transduction histidine kinase